MTTDAEGAPTIHTVSFRGSGAEYFRIWIVNVALTLATLGIYSAWAKVRTRRYFYGNTVIDGHGFEYHAEPWRILIGRAISVAMLVAAVIGIVLVPASIVVWALAFAAALPWLANNAIGFHARNTSWRNVRFNFHAGYRDAALACVVWPVAAVALLPLPLSRRVLDYFYINHHRFGGHAFTTRFGAGRVYVLYLLGFVMLGAMVFAMVAGAMTVAEMATRLPKLFGGVDFSFFTDNLQTVFLVLAGLGVALIVKCVTTLVRNLAIGSTTLDGDFRLASRASGLAVAWIVVSNAVLILVTLGLYYPFGSVRLARYRMGKVEVIAHRDLEAFTAEALDEQSAIGREVAGGFGL